MYEAIIFIILTILCIMIFLIGQLVHKQYTRKDVIYLLVMLCLGLVGYGAAFAPNELISLIIPTIILMIFLVLIVLKFTKLN